MINGKAQDHLIYLATPYSHNDPAVRQRRFEVVNRVTAAMYLRGMYVFSPISHGHPVAEAGQLPGDWMFWEAHNLVMLRRCTELFVLQQEGWENSKGVAAEMEAAATLRIPITHIGVDEYGASR